MKYVLGVLVLLLGGAAYWLLMPAQEDTPAAVSGRAFGNPALVLVEAVRRDTIIDTLEAIGTTSANESVVLTAKVTDTVSRIRFDDGDYASAGEVLVELTNDEESALLAEAQANMDEAAAQLRRLQDLDRQRLVSRSDLDQARAQADAARGRLNAILARLDDRLVRAPFDGLLGFREISPGSLLTSNSPITTLDDISVIKLDFSVPELYLDVVRPGLNIVAHSAAWPERRFTGDIRTVGSRVNPVTRAVTVRAMVQNEERMLRPGMLMTVQIQTSPREALIIDEAALVQLDRDTFVYIAGADGRAHIRQVETGVRRRGSVEILSGLEEGELVITDGVVSDGAPYRTPEATSAPAPGQQTAPEQAEHQMSDTRVPSVPAGEPGERSAAAAG